MAKMRINGLLPSFSNPGQLTQSVMSHAGGGASGVLGALTGKTPAAAAGNQQQNGNAAQDAIKGLGGLFGKKPQQ
jgi:hypothetical protein